VDYRDLDTELRRRRKEILVRIVGAFDRGDFSTAIGEEAKNIAAEWGARCEKSENIGAEVNERIAAALGFSMAADTNDISALAASALKRSEPEEYPLTVLESTCNRCPAIHYAVTGLCRSCTAKYCQAACRFGAISMVDGASKIDSSKCKKCDQCRRSCPYGAIVKATVPCESQCPVDAIKKDETGRSRIDFDRCISCGRCSVACPFGAIVSKSQIVDVLRAMASRETIALYAPSWIGQYDATAGKLRSALEKAGFSGSCEVALGAEVTAIEEADDFRSHLAGGKPFMTTSCCAAYNEFRDKHLVEINPYASKTKTPLYYTAEILRKKHPNAALVFLSPCFAKYREVRRNPNVDFALNFEEVDALFAARSVSPESCDAMAFDKNSAKEAREFGLSNGVARSVVCAWKGDSSDVKPVVINGLNKESIGQLRSYAREGKCSDGNLVEVMACEGGCIGGPATICSLRKAQQRVSSHASEGQSIGEVKNPFADD
jgi:[FeFe] hydrogenase (group B1/B3)